MVQEIESLTKSFDAPLTPLYNYGGLGQSVDSDESSVSTRQFQHIFFDVSDLLQYCRDNRSPTGIQRVQIRIVENAAKAIANAVPVAMVPGLDSWRPIDLALFASLCALSRTGSDASDPAWLACVAAVEACVTQGKSIAFPPDSAIVNLGSSWWLPNYFQTLSDAKAAHGLSYVPFIHDVIPVKVPEHCPINLVREFTQWIYQVLVYADVVLVNSKQTAIDVKELAWRIHGREIEPIVCTLDADPDLFDKADCLQISSDLERLIAKPFVLFVATVESRKNHLFVFDAWIDLVRKVGIDRAPSLVCVGKLGWLSEAAIGRLQNSYILQEKTSILSGISDVELSFLYGNCLFTVYNSFYEGWGLPVTESLCAGKVPLVARNTSLTEAGGEFAVYFQPSNREDFDARLHELIFDTVYRASLEERIENDYKARSWRSISEQVIANVTSAAFSIRRSREDGIEYARTYGFHSMARPGFRHEDLKGALLRKGLAWSHPEQWGIWTTQRCAQLEFHLPDANDEALFYIGLNMPGEAIDISFQVNGWSSNLVAGRTCTYLLRVPVASLGQGRVRLEIINGTLIKASQSNPGDCRTLGVGLRYIKIVRLTDVDARMSMIESGEDIVTVDARESICEVW